MFSTFDVDGDGTMDADELGTILTSLGKHPTQQELWDMINKVDEDCSGAIEWKEFIMLMVETTENERKREKALREAEHAQMMKKIHDMKDSDMDRLVARAAEGKKARADEKAEMK